MERQRLAQHCVSNNAERVNVGARIDGLAAGLLGRHVLGGSKNGAYGGDLCVGQLGNGKIEQLDKIRCTGEVE